jgi:uncharacterized protein (UPF0276 family)
VSVAEDRANAATALAGIGLREPHMTTFLAEPQPVGWVEVHSENYLCSGGPRRAAIEEVRTRYPISCHGVGLSLGSADGLDQAHLTRLKRLFDRLDPMLTSEHLAWSVSGDHYWADLLPLPYSKEALDVVCRNVAVAQEAFGRQLLIENPTPYIAFDESEMPEAAFLAALVGRTGCGLLLDLNNLFVNCRNHRIAPGDYLDWLPGDAIGEYHLAGHSPLTIDGDTVLIDDHGAPVSPAVWDLYEEALDRFGVRPVLVEWDLHLPALSTLIAEATAAGGRAAKHASHAHAA